MYNNSTCDQVHLSLAEFAVMSVMYYFTSIYTVYHIESGSFYIYKSAIYNKTLNKGLVSLTQNTGVMFFKPGIRNVHHKRNKMTPKGHRSIAHLVSPHAGFVNPMDHVSYGGP